MDRGVCVCVCVARSRISSEYVCTQYSEPKAPHCVANAACSIRTEYQSHFIQSCVLSSTSSNYKIIVSSLLRAKLRTVDLDFNYWFWFLRSAWLRVPDPLPQNYIRKKQHFVCQLNFASLRSIINRTRFFFGEAVKFNRQSSIQIENKSSAVLISRCWEKLSISNEFPATTSCRRCIRTAPKHKLHV